MERLGQESLHFVPRHIYVAELCNRDRIDRQSFSNSYTGNLRGPRSFSSELKVRISA